MARLRDKLLFPRWAKKDGSAISSFCILRRCQGGSQPIHTQQRFDFNLKIKLKHCDCCISIGFLRDFPLEMSKLNKTVFRVVS